MLTEICGYLKNWFNRRPDGTDYPKFNGRYEISNGTISCLSGDPIELLNGQYFRIIGSVLNEGVFQYSDTMDLKDEIFDGIIWAMAVPTDVIALAEEIASWKEKNAGALSSAFSSENLSANSYSYSLKRGDEMAKLGWQVAFGNRLTRYKKL